MGSDQTLCSAPHFGRFFAISREPQALTDLEGRFVAVNDAWQQTLGWPAGVLIGRPFWEFTFPGDVPGTVQEPGGVSRSARFTSRFLTRRGDWRWLEWVSEPSPEEELVYVTARDASEPFEAEQEPPAATAAARAPETEHLARMVDASAQVLLSTDREGRIRSANPYACRLYGYTEAELQGRPVLELVAAGHLEIREEVAEATRLGGSWHGELVHVDRSGRVFPVAVTVSPVRDEHGMMAGNVVLAVDISARKTAEAELAAANLRFRQTLTHAPGGIALVGLDGEMLEVNDAFCRILGYSREEVSDKRLHDLTHPADLDLDRQHIDELLSGARESYAMEKRSIHRDGGELWILCTVSLVRAVDGAPLHFITQMLDVTDRKLAEQRLRTEADADALTGVGTRRRFEDALTLSLASARRHHERSALLFIDLDHFKAINDDHGHAVGDEVLRRVALALQSRARATDSVGRFGGDEFVVLADRLDEVEARGLRADLALAVESVRVVAERGTVCVAASIGMAVFDGVGLATPGEVLAAADADMYADKAARTASGARRAGR